MLIAPFSALFGFNYPPETVELLKKLHRRQKGSLLQPSTSTDHDEPIFRPQSRASNASTTRPPLPAYQPTLTTFSHHSVLSTRHRDLCTLRGCPLLHSPTSNTQTVVG